MNFRPRRLTFDNLLLKKGNIHKIKTYCEENRECIREGDIEYALETACQYNDIITVTYFSELKNNIFTKLYDSVERNILAITIYDSVERYFTFSCKGDNLDVAKMINEKWNNNPLNKRVIEPIRLLELSCEHGAINITHWLSNLIGTTNHSHINEKLLQSVCKNGNMKLVLWLSGLIGTNNHKHLDQQLFDTACQYNHRDIAVWLYNLGNINIRANNDYAFKKTTNLKIMKWLSSMCPDYVLYFVDGCFVDKGITGVTNKT